MSTWDKIEKPLMAGLLCAAVFFVATQRRSQRGSTVVKLAGFFAEPRAFFAAGKS